MEQVKKPIYEWNESINTETEILKRKKKRNARTEKHSKYKKWKIYWKVSKADLNSQKKEEVNLKIEIIESEKWIISQRTLKKA